MYVSVSHTMNGKIACQKKTECANTLTQTRARSLARSLSLAIRLWGVSISLKMYSIYVSVYFFLSELYFKIVCMNVCVQAFSLRL